MNYRTLLTDPNTPSPKPIQAFHPNPQVAADWTTVALSNAGPNAFVTLYAVVEVVVHTYRQPKPKLKPAPEEAAQ